MKLPRESGILLHPTSLPGGQGIGDLGDPSLRFVDKLREIGQHIWQVLPVGPTGYGDSPYQSESTFAGNPLLISVDCLVDLGLLGAAELDGVSVAATDRVDFGAVISVKFQLLGLVTSRFSDRAGPELKAQFDEFCDRHNRVWLDDYAMYVALKTAHGNQPWYRWDSDLVRRDAAALRRAHADLANEIDSVRVIQFLFDLQWHELRRRCESQAVRLVGDVPIYIAHDSADAWAEQALLELDDDGLPTSVSGVPPDYFSATGQRWGNPLYRWNRMAETGYAWWKKRMLRMTELFDLVRVDHFRGFESYWQIPADEPTAVAGRWVPGPGEQFFRELISDLGELPIIAEDLGVITPEVEALRDRFDFPGMRVLQFAFGNDPMAESYRPENYIENCVCYTGTHDNDTTVGWFRSAEGEGTTRKTAEIEAERRTVLDFLGTDGQEIHWDLIGAALDSKANSVIFPMQDLLGLGSEARMNTPGTATGNWCWRFRWPDLTDEAVGRLRHLAESAGRIHR